MYCNKMSKQDIELEPEADQSMHVSRKDFLKKSIDGESVKVGNK